MVIDIVKFFFIYSLVLFSFACGNLFRVSLEAIDVPLHDKLRHPRRYFPGN
jgi:hypothetical protein